MSSKDNLPVLVSTVSIEVSQMNTPASFIFLAYAEMSAALIDEADGDGDRFRELLFAVATAATPAERGLVLTQFERTKTHGFGGELVGAEGLRRSGAFLSFGTCQVKVLHFFGISPQEVTER